ncbi:MAG: DUF4338 domain-containing protein [Sulfurihydrogenibium sp.]|jgi:hypothetical protein|nr:DUF4338 domain-containing protein [Sulfurihydrogenibium sp.]
MQEFINRLAELKKAVDRNPREFMKNLASELNPKLSTKYRKYFTANKQEIEPTKIKLELIPVNDTFTDELFKSAMSFWSVPLSAGYGRRMRYIILDKQHYKVFGIFGLCDPVIGLKVRDDFIGWNREQKQDRLYNILTAYILGAIPPYNELYGSKLVALTVGSKEVSEDFFNKYNGKKTVIKERTPIPKLVAIDTMAFFGKSLIYEGLREWQFVGFSKGYTHHHLTSLWNEALELAKKLNLKTLQEETKFNHGFSWKLRVWNDLFSALKISKDYLTTEISKGYYFRPLIENWKEFLTGTIDETFYINKSFEEYVEYWSSKYMRKRINKFVKNT